MRRASGALLCIVLVACGRGASVQTAADAAAIVPWTNALAPDVATPFTIPGVAACAASDVAVSVHVANPSYIGAGPMNTAFWDIDITDRGAHPCFVGARPAVTFSRDGIPVPIPRATSPFAGDIAYLAPPALAAPPFFPHATGEIDVTPCVPEGVDRVTVDLGGRLGRVDAAPGPPGGTGRACPAPGEGYDAELRGQAADDIAGGFASAAQTTMRGPTVVHAGDVVRFTVTVENTPSPRSMMAGTRPTPNPTLTWSPCPSYHEELEGVPGTFHTYRLNCAAAQPIANGGSETFAMSLMVPASAQSGPATLVWSLDGSPTRYQAARLDVEIE
jgi:hypothetical protein